MATTTTTGASNSTDPPPPSSSSASAKTGFLKTCFNGVDVLSGSLVCHARSTEHGSWSSLAVFLAIAVICCYTGILLQRCMDASPLVTTYPDVGALAFGRRGRLLVAAFMYLELYLVAVDFLILEGDNLHKLFRGAGFRLGGLRVPRASPLVHWAGMPSAISLYSFCFSGHAVFPMIYNGMKERRKFPMVLFICFALSTLSYGFMGIVGYLMNGDALMSQVTLNLPSGKVSSKVAIYTTLVNPLTKYALVVAPIAEAIEASLGVLVRTALVVGTAVVALAVPFFADVVALTGALLSCTATMLLPILCYLRVRAKVGSRSRGWRRRPAWLLLWLVPPMLC
ncbi:hypothetical protein BAE44_0017814 [Dichanthelium oligosanthes]|uniref:Amino acid transporter transmembrane domain-containing protein n=1 Tax=Dichanthelium oligosanthes TaxID=888268 RepID=A0A1E5V7Z1_9POAL|nr:hypothetical protein BAE44_0017814 [Dichanthelium oligosanthes]